MILMIVAIPTAITQVMAMVLLGIVLLLLIWHDVQNTSNSSLLLLRVKLLRNARNNERIAASWHLTQRSFCKQLIQLPPQTTSKNPLCSHSPIQQQKHLKGDLHYVSAGVGSAIAKAAQLRRSWAPVRDCHSNQSTDMDFELISSGTMLSGGAFQPTEPSRPLSQGALQMTNLCRYACTGNGDDRYCNEMTVLHVDGILEPSHAPKHAWSLDVAMWVSLNQQLIHSCVRSRNSTDSKWKSKGRHICTWCFLALNEGCMSRLAPPDLKPPARKP